MTGPILLFGSGETSPSGRKAFDLALRYVMETNAVEESRKSYAPKVALLETPAGFELNSLQVIGRVAEYLETHLANYNPKTEIVRARKRGTIHSPDNPEIAARVLPADVIFLGPGSPSYTIRQLADSLTWKAVQYRHAQGAALALASAAALSVSAHSLPVYEIYKVGEDPFWKRGLDLFGPNGLELVFVPHWNNNDGGSELDTSRCFMGVERFELMKAMLPETAVIAGIEENTILWMDPQEACCRVIGSGGIAVIKGGKETHYAEGQTFPMSELGPYRNQEPVSEAWIPELEAYLEREQVAPEQPSQEVRDLLEQRLAARSSKDYAAADRIRDEIAALGWQVEDTPDGPRLVKN